MLSSLRALTKVWPLTKYLNLNHVQNHTHIIRAADSAVVRSVEFTRRFQYTYYTIL